MVSAVGTYAARRAAHVDQQRRLFGEIDGDPFASMAAMMRPDLGAEPTGDVADVLVHLEAADTVVDVGGGAGRVSLVLASRCRGVVNVEPSPSLCAEFDRCAAEHGISNAGSVNAEWLDAPDDLSADLVIAIDMAYGLRDVSAFVDKLNRACRRRVIMSVHASMAMPAAVFEAAHGESEAPVPAGEDLVAVLRGSGVDVEAQSHAIDLSGEPLPQTREEAVGAVAMRVAQPWMPRSGPDVLERATSAVVENFDVLFEHAESGFVPAFLRDLRTLWLTWTV